MSARSCFLAAVLSLLFAAEHGWAGETPSFEIVDLGRLDGAFATQPLAINNKGEVVGYCQGPQTQLRAFVWRPGQGMIELPPPPGFNYNRATDISENGIICGVAQNGIEGMPFSWRWMDGAYEMLPPTLSGCDFLFAEGVNNDGTVVGRTQVSNVTCTNRAFYYSDKGGLIDLTALFNAQTAMDINNNGTATGEAFDSAYRYNPATGPQFIGTLPPYDDGAQGHEINDNNDVCGRAHQALIGPDAWRAFLYTDETGMQNISEWLLARSSASGLNIDRDVVGNDGTSSSPEQHPWLWTPETGRIALAPLFEGHTDWCCVCCVRDINDTDQIIGKAHSGEPNDPFGYGVILTPVVKAKQGDVNGDGSVNVDDLIAVINAWGKCDDVANCPSDIAPAEEGNGAVDTDDLLMVINNWG